jgi:imidazole glycerol-phosphate synthase subunit HisH
MIQIIDYKAGNLTSVKRALDHIGIPAAFSADSDTIRKAERIIFPGVGHAASAMAVLRSGGLDKALQEAFSRGTPIMGICLGCQIVLSASEEGDTTCIGLIPGRCRRFALQTPGLKIPHMGWNSIDVVQRHPILQDVQPGDEFYFVHSYYPQPDDRDDIIATCEYETVFPAVIGHKNLFATQFHPEKSGEPGLTMLRNFAQWDGLEC